MSFNEDAVVRRLSTLTDSGESVQTIALWLTTQSKQSRRTVEVWRDEIRKGKAARENGSKGEEFEGHGIERGPARRKAAAQQNEERERKKGQDRPQSPSQRRSARVSWSGAAAESA